VLTSKSPVCLPVSGFTAITPQLRRTHDQAERLLRAFFNSRTNSTIPKLASTSNRSNPAGPNNDASMTIQQRI